MILASIIFALFIITLFVFSSQRSLVKNSLKDKTTNQLLKMRQEAFIDYRQAKAMKLYGVMGHRAQVMCNIDQELTKKISLNSPLSPNHFKMKSTARIRNVVREVYIPRLNQPFRKIND
jgi:hypothetical protein